MDGHEQALAYAQANFAAVNDSFVQRLRQTFAAFDSGKVLDLGCGPADIPVRLCRVLGGVRVWAVDASEAMLLHARGVVDGAGLGDRIMLVRAHCPAHVPPGDFDAVMSNSILHHLPDPHVLWQQIKDSAAPGAAIFIQDLMRPNSQAQAQEIVDTYAAGEPEILRHDFYHSLLAAFTPQEVRQQLVAHDLSHLTVEAISDRHLLVYGHL